LGPDSFLQKKGEDPGCAEGRRSFRRREAPQGLGGSKACHKERGEGSVRRTPGQGRGRVADRQQFTTRLSRNRRDNKPTRVKASGEGQRKPSASLGKREGRNLYPRHRRESVRERAFPYRTKAQIEGECPPLEITRGHHCRKKKHSTSITAHAFFFKKEPPLLKGKGAPDHRIKKEKKRRGNPHVRVFNWWEKTPVSLSSLHNGCMY